MLDRAEPQRLCRVDLRTQDLPLPLLEEVQGPWGSPLPDPYEPSRGRTSDVAGTCSMTPSRNTVIASSIVIASDTWRCTCSGDTPHPPACWLPLQIEREK